MAYNKLKCTGQVAQQIREVGIRSAPPSIIISELPGAPGQLSTPAGPIEVKLDTNKQELECLLESLRSLSAKLRPILNDSMSEKDGEGKTVGESALAADLDEHYCIIQDCLGLVASISRRVEL